IEDARRIASELRSSTVRTLAFDLDGHPQVSFNLLEPTIYGPQTAFDAVAKLAPIDRAELVGLMPAAALSQIPSSRWADLDLAEDRTIEARLAKAGFDKEPLPPPPPAPPAWAANGSGPVRPVKPVDERTDDLFDWLI
ncbi:MAG TPA: hypothetical protein VGS21_10510, partial [Acidimicrobiales bacterium]|nr:hypothetical protein [Acidimicrobiales bacterium]